MPFNLAIEHACSILPASKTYWPWGQLDTSPNLRALTVAHFSAFYFLWSLSGIIQVVTLHKIVSLVHFASQDVHDVFISHHLVAILSTAKKSGARKAKIHVYLTPTVYTQHIRFTHIWAPCDLPHVATYHFQGPTSEFDLQEGGVTAIDEFSEVK